MRDERFKAALLFSASAYPFEGSLSGVGVPLTLMVGDNDPAFMHPELPRRAVFDGAPPPRYLAVAGDADHFPFGDRVRGKTRLHIAAENDAQANAVCRYGHEFMRAYLRGSSSAPEEIEEPDVAFAYCVEVI